MKWFTRVLAAATTRLLMALAVAVVGGAMTEKKADDSASSADIAMGYITLGDFEIIKGGPGGETATP